MCKTTPQQAANSQLPAVQEKEGPITAEEKRRVLQTVRAKAQHFFRHEFSAWDLVDPEKPWVLVDQGSFLGGFDFVPREFRAGPWNILVCLHFAVIVYAVGLACIYVGGVKPSLEGTSESSSHPYFHCFPAYSSQWWWNLAGLAWTTFVALSCVFRGAGVASWMTFTVQSWTLIQLRFGLAVLSPFYPSLVPLSEYLRLPMLAQSTVTFVAWNFLLGPVLFTMMDTPYKREKFVEIFTNFRLTQLHVANVFLAAFQGIRGTPARSLEEADLCVACVLVTAYSFFYLGLLDRLGIHFYLVYSPRSTIAILTWSLTYAAVYVSWIGWGHLITKHGSSVEGSVVVAA